MKFRKTMEDVTIHESDYFTHFAWLNSCFDSMDNWLMSYGEQIGVLGDQMSSIDDRMIGIEMNQESLFRDFYGAYFVPLRGDHIAYNPDALLDKITFIFCCTFSHLVSNFLR